MILNKHKNNILEIVWSLVLGLMSATTIYGIRLEIIPIWVFSSVIVGYIIYGAVKQ